MKNIELLSLAAFLHDIGKFRQRAKRDISDALISQYCPSYKQHYSHIHAAHTAEAIDELGFKIDNLIELAASHHRQNLDEDLKIIQIADRYASSLDRKESEDTKNSLSKDEFIKTAIETPFSYVYLEKNPKMCYYSLQKLSKNLKISSEKHINSSQKYEELYAEFVSKVKSLNLSFNNINDFLKLKSIYEEYTTFIPSSTYKTYPDVSLFDHSLATAAIAVAIKKGDGKNFSLIQGDFTSIQNFIFSKYGESNRYLAKILRAKSLFVNIATELIALKTIKELGLSVFNIVMNAGGKFTILSHKLSQSDIEKLQEIKNWVNEEFKKINFLETKFIIKSIDFTDESFKLGEFSKVYKSMAREFETEKLRFESDVEVFEGYIKSLSNNGKCDICGIQPAVKKEENQNICEFCEKFKRLGESLVKKDKISFDLDDILSITMDENKEIFYYLNSGYPKKRVANVVPIFNKNDLQNPRYKLLDDEDIKDIKDGFVKSFQVISVDGLKEDDKYFYGRKYLAILKADIDNLGQIFIRGFHKEETFSRILYLSRMVDYFFTDILMDKIKGKNIYTLFAGGDDLFLIGYYEDIFEIYEWLIDEFKEYTKNEDFHLSAAIKLTRASVPLNLMAELSESELDEAKSNRGKNSVTVFGVVMRNDEFREFYKKQDFFKEIYEELKGKESGISFMYRFYDFIQMSHTLKQEKNDFFTILNNSRWRYMFNYLVEKNIEDESLKEKLYEVKDLIEEYDKKLYLPLNLFLYSIRTYHKES